MTSDSVALHPALQPFVLKHHTLRNRLSLAPMSRVSAHPDGRPTAEMLAYYEAFATGGFGLLITEGTYPDTEVSQGYTNQPGMATDAHEQAWAPIVAAVHGAGAVFIQQLMHAGSLSQHVARPVGPSAVRPPGAMMPSYGRSGPYLLPEALTGPGIAQIVNGFVQAAQRAERAGFDGIEIHGANGYLVDQFITDYSNLREDQYGGPAANKIRLAAEIVAAVKAAVAPAFIIGVRLSQTKVNDSVYQWPGQLEEAEVYFRALTAAGADYLHLANEGKAWLETATDAAAQSLGQLARAVTGLPVIVNGGLHDPERSRQNLAEGHADVVALGRWAVANPDYPQKLAAREAIVEFAGGMIYPAATLANTQAWLATHEAAYT